jgi:hypothetical protein
METWRYSTSFAWPFGGSAVLGSNPRLGHLYVFDTEFLLFAAFAFGETELSGHAAVE